jgi:CubicO group peptidase (beta-lactamase class C family)
MAATAIMRLAAAGRLSLDDPAPAHVPELRGSPWAEHATLRDLLANRSRLPLSAELEFETILGEDDDVLSRFATKIAAGERSPSFWCYSNAGWCLLGRALETVTKLTWEDAMQANLIAPLELGQTAFANRQGGVPVVSGHGVVDGQPAPVAPWTPRAFAPAGSTLLMTVHDLIRFAREHLDNAALDVMRDVHAEVGIHTWIDAWCLGWARFDWHGGPVWGWDGLVPGQRSILRFVPGRGAVALLTNADTGRALYRALFPSLMSELFGIDMPALRLEPAPAAAGDLTRFAGVYAWPDRSWKVTPTDTGLLMEGSRRTVGALPIDERTFLVDAADSDNPTMTFGAFDDDDRPGVLYQMIWGLPRVERGRPDPNRRPLV